MTRQTGSALKSKPRWPASEAVGLSHDGETVHLEREPDLIQHAAVGDREPRIGGSRCGRLVDNFRGYGVSAAVQAEIQGLVHGVTFPFSARPVMNAALRWLVTWVS
jgi:hypothetical protein